MDKFHEIPEVVMFFRKDDAFTHGAGEGFYYERETTVLFNHVYVDRIFGKRRPGRGNTSFGQDLLGVKLE
ncbi:hypothetical protein MSSAC_1366 [Methanosarcina siciliae C2J]|uniref:Uncharacterized protein n=1 Tax=Methanosarcina siciliae C2J TaxID=1434118 RepID=A0A0E3LCR0_9EURY|nr:hypothetical protein MSSAC_1366 [Methanosarcina siciliae C2J]